MKEVKSISFFLSLILMSFTTAFNKDLFGQQQPDTVRVDTISIVNDQIYLTWMPNTDNTTRYVIYRITWNGAYFIIDSIGQNVGINNTLFVDLSVDACDSTHAYLVLAKNADGLSSNFQGTKGLRSLYLAEPYHDICNNLVRLRWTRYLNMPNGLGRYSILASTSGENGVFSEIGSALPSDTTFVHDNLAQNTKYTYMIRAISSDGVRSSSTCMHSVISYTPRQPDSVYLHRVSVENNQHILLEWTKGNEAPKSAYRILRSVNGISYDTIAVIEDLNLYDPAITFIDEDADFSNRSYYYQIRICDSCIVDTLASVNVARSIHLTGFPDFSNNIFLAWNAYEGWDLGVQEYRIYREINGVPDPVGPLEIVTSAITTYADDVSGYLSSEGVFTYRVEAVENDGNNGYENFKDMSLSNEIVIELETRVVVPNAFTPGRPPDDVFSPLVAFIDAQGYELSVFNKWGQIIFNTTNPAEGWNGTFNGEYVQSDVYVYLLKYRTPEGLNLQRKGTVTVVR